MDPSEIIKQSLQASVADTGFSSASPSPNYQQKNRTPIQVMGFSQQPTPDAHFAWSGQYLYDRQPQMKPAEYGGHGPEISSFAGRGEVPPSVADAIRKNAGYDNSAFTDKVGRGESAMIPAIIPR